MLTTFGYLQTVNYSKCLGFLMHQNEIIKEIKWVTKYFSIKPKDFKPFKI